MHQYTCNKIESLLNEKRDIEEKSAALKAEIAEVEAANIKVDSNEEIINNRVEGIKFDIAKGKETYSDLEDRLAELENKKKRAEEQQQIFQLFEEFDSSFTAPTVVEPVGSRLKISDIASQDEIFEAAGSVIAEGYLKDLLELSDNPFKYYTEEQFESVKASFKYSNTDLYKLEPREVLDVLGRQYVILTVLASGEYFTTHYTEKQQNEIVAELLQRERLFAKDDYEEARSFLIVSQLEGDTAEVNSSSDGRPIHYTPLETPYVLDQEVEDIIGDKDDGDIYYKTNPEDEVILASQIDNAAMDNFMDSVEEDENIEEAISNAESQVSIPTYIEEELEVMATTPSQLTPEEEVEFYTQGNISSALVLVTQEPPKKVEPMLEKSGYAPNNITAFKENLYDKSQELEWYKGTLKEAIAASDSCFDKDCLNYIRHFVKGVPSTKVYTFNAHNNLIEALRDVRVSNIVQFIEHGLLQYFQVGYTEQPFTEEEYNQISMYLIEKRYLKS